MANIRWVSWLAAGPCAPWMGPWKSPCGSVPSACRSHVVMMYHPNYQSIFTYLFRHKIGLPSPNSETGLMLLAASPWHFSVISAVTVPVTVPVTVRCSKWQFIEKSQLFSSMGNEKKEWVSGFVVPRTWTQGHPLHSSGHGGSLSSGRYRGTNRSARAAPGRWCRR